MTQVSKQLEAARQKLLDLTMRNRLLNFRPTKARTIRGIDGIPKEIYDILILKEGSIGFRPKPRDPENTRNVRNVNKEEQTFPEEPDDPDYPEDPEEDVSANPAEVEENSRFLELPIPEVESTDYHSGHSLQTLLEQDRLQRRLFSISQQAQSIFEEQGYTVLYLAMGFLEWAESQSAGQLRRAPLILIPVELKRIKVGASFKLHWTGEDILTNISLQAKILDQRISLPDFEMPDDPAYIDKYLRDVKKSVSHIPKWRVETDISLDFFSFTKFVMYKDLDPDAWPKGMTPETHPLIQALLNPSSSSSLSHQNDRGFSEDEIDKKLSVRDLYHVMDADPSQIAVIEDVKAGRNLVVEGPPGTGKSQTITNTIAELMAKGKSVLFVSEKMAALEVVKSRLDGTCLGDFCLELHSRKSNKKEVLKDLYRAISSSSLEPASLEEKFDRLETLKSDLNGYAQALNDQLGKLERTSPFTLFGTKETANQHFAKAGRSMPRVNFPNPEKCDQKEWSTAKSKLQDLTGILPLVRPVNRHPWRGCKPGTVLPSDEEDIGRLISEYKDAVRNIDTAIDHLIRVCAIQRPTTLEELQQAIIAAKVMAVSEPVDRNVLLNQEWNKPSEQAERLIQKVEALQNQLSAMTSQFQPKALDQDIASLLEEYKILSARFFRFFNFRYRYLKREISTLYKAPPHRSATKIIADLEQLADCLRIRSEIRGEEQTGQAFFGSHWRAEESDPSMLRDFAAWIINFRRQLLGRAITEQAVDIVSAGISREQAEKAAEEAAEAAKRLINQGDLLFKCIGGNCEAIFGTKADKVPFSALLSQLDLWKAELPRLRQWAQFIALRDDCLKTVANPVIAAIESDSLEPEDIIPCFEGNFADDLLRCAFAERPCLARFGGDLHEHRIKNFMELDRELITRNHRRLAYKLYQEQQQVRRCISGGASPESEAGILLKEFSRKRGHMPIRKLMVKAGSLIQKIKPCFMMSPLSIAQFLDPLTVRFDVIIFDEASQVKPEDALGALLRGNQLVVMGDTRQLPPTSFFDHMVDPIEDEEQESVCSVVGMESILHQCKLSFHTKTLRWHYRSRHESLIAVSNQEFYDNRLLIYPSPIDRAEHLGLQFTHLPDAVYDRGRSSVNRKEAKAVAEASLEHYRRSPDKSLGVGTFGIRQQQAVLEEIELQIHLHPEMEDFFKSSRKEHFFVKNLETIQGDERDVIFISIGFGFDDSGRLNRNFGPLNQEGGERRLNVLISRSRERCVVFSNFRAKDLPLDATLPFGLRALHVFLKYAETRDLHSSAVATGADTDSPFEDAVYDFLRNHGYEVRKQVGCAGFRVDLAIVDPQSPGRYLLGIECDGAKYHSSPVARDRDRLRQQILEELGWCIYRVWSTDWYRNRSDSERNLLDAIEEARKGNLTPMSMGTRALQEQPTYRVGQVPHSIREGAKSLEPSTIARDLDNKAAGYKVPDYKVCSSLGITVGGNLHDQPQSQLAKAIAKVVEVEGPVHFDEVVRRIRTLWGLKRTGQRITDALSKAALLAERDGKIRRHDDFLWQATDCAVPVRRRCGDPPVKIELICDEEITEAIKLVLKQQFDTPPHELSIQASRLLGFQVTHDETLQRIETIINTLLNNGELQKRLNGMIHFSGS